jgi:hypothetical protein
VGFFLHVDRKPYLVPEEVAVECELRDVIHSFAVIEAISESCVVAIEILLFR